jgi:predicted PurR-regulated permease PerM
MTSNIPASRTSFWGIALALAAAALIYALSTILMPFVLGTLLAYICHPLAARLTRPWFPSALASLLVLLLLTSLIALFGVLVVPMLYHEINEVLARLPAAISGFRQWSSPWLQDVLGVDFGTSVSQVRELVLQNIGSTELAMQKVVNSASEGGRVLLEILVTLLLVPVVFFYLLKDWNRLIPKLQAAIPSTHRARVTDLALEIDTMLGQFLRGQLLVMAAMACFYSIGLSLAGLNAGLAIGLLTGFLVFIPYIGVFTGFVLAMLAALVQDPGNTALLLPVAGVYALGHALEGTVVTPRLVGERIGLHPVAVIFALMAFGKLLGFFGVVVALPATAVLWVLVRRLCAPRMEAGEGR